MAQQNSSSPKFFKRYNRIILATLAFVFLIDLGLFYLQFQSNYQYNQNQLVADFQSRVAILNTVTQSARDRVKILQTAAQDYLLSHPIADRPPSLLFSALTESEASEAYLLSQTPPPLEQADVGQILGKGRLAQLDLSQMRELELSFALNPLFKAITQNIPNVSWVYHFSRANFMNLYPWPSFDASWFSEELYDYDFYQLARPESNPEREIVWTPAYVDAAHAGLMVTGSAPVYEAEEFHGIVALDLTLDALSQYVRDLEIRGRSQPNLFVIDRDQQLLAHSTLVTLQDTEVKAAQLALPEPLRDRLAEIDNLPPGKFHKVGDYGLIHQDFQAVPWELLLWVPRRELIVATLASTNVLFLVLLPGLGLILAIANYLTRKEFIQPAELLVAHIDRECESAADIPADIPSAWQPWFEQITESFAQKRRLYQQAQDYAQQLKDSQLQLVQSEKMSALGNLVAGIAHEINNPVGFLKGNIKPAQDYVQDLLGLLDLYQQKMPSPDAEIKDETAAIDLEFIREDLPKLLSSMNLGVDRIRNISDSLRTFSRQDQDRKTKFNLHDGLDSTLLILKHRMKANEQRPEIEVVKHYGELPNIECFPGQLNQVFMNILANAVDSFDEVNRGKTYQEIAANPNRIGLRTMVVDGWIQIRIQDNGCGMKPATVERIFEQGFTTKAVGTGTGLGMAIAHQAIVEKHSGTLACQSKLGEGTTFTIALPKI